MLGPALTADRQPQPNQIDRQTRRRLGRRECVERWSEPWRRSWELEVSEVRWVIRGERS